MPVDLLGVCVWTLILTHSALVCSEVHFLEVSEGDSVLLPCSLDRGQPAPYGVYLKRDWLKHDSQVLYKYEDSEFSASDDYRKRMTVSGDPRQFSVNVSISELTAGDTDRYVCDFIINQDVGEDVIRRGRHDFFILVHAGVGCSCSSYSILLYALSSAVVVLLVLLVGLLLLCRSKSRRNAKSHPAAPIYEEMTVVQPPGRKPGHLEEAQCSEYNNCPARRSGENHYEVPSGGPPRGALHGAPTH